MNWPQTANNDKITHHTQYPSMESGFVSETYDWGYIGSL